MELKIGNKTLTLSSASDRAPKTYSFRDQSGNGYATGRTADGMMKILATSFVKNKTRHQYREYKSISENTFSDLDFQALK